MNNPEKTPPLPQETSGQILQKKPTQSQEHFSVLDEEQLEEITGGSPPKTRAEMTPNERQLDAQRLRDAEYQAERPGVIELAENAGRVIGRVAANSVRIMAFARKSISPLPK
jgi:hypothetical protein